MTSTANRATMACCVQPIDRDGHVIKAAGSIKVTLLDPPIRPTSTGGEYYSTPTKRANSGMAGCGRIYALRPPGIRASRDTMRSPRGSVHRPAHRQADAGRLQSSSRPTRKHNRVTRFPTNLVVGVALFRFGPPLPEVGSRFGQPMRVPTASTTNPAEAGVGLRPEMCLSPR